MYDLLTQNPNHRLKPNNKYLNSVAQPESTTSYTDWSPKRLHDGQNWIV